MDLAPLFVLGETISDPIDAIVAPFPSKSYLQSQKRSKERFRKEHEQINSTTIRNNYPFCQKFNKEVTRI